MPQPGPIGLNVSTFFMRSPRPDPQFIVSRLLQMHVTNAKTFGYTDTDASFIAAAHRKMTLVVGIPNDQLAALAQGRTQPLIDAIRPHADSIAWLCVGNEPLGTWFKGAYDGTLVPAVRQVHAALRKAGLKIGVTVPQNFEFMAQSYPPSAGAINPKLAGIIKETCDVMKSSGAPFMVNIYPFLTRRDNRKDVPLDYCLFRAPQSQWVRDGSFTYTNIFDAMLDALHVALGRIGCGDLEIVVGECGWPTGGDQDATIENARLFNQSLIDHCKSKAGTPRLPNRPIRCFVFEMFDEVDKSTEPGPFETQWGVLDANGEAKYALSW